METRIERKPFSLHPPGGGTISGDLSLGRTERSPVPVLIFCHGFKGFKDWGGWPYMAEQLAETGFAVITFNFSHNGVGADLFEFTEPDKFKENTYSREEAELRFLLDAVRRGAVPLFERLDSERIGLIGHSRGGFAALIAGSSERGVQAVATLASIADVSGVSTEEEERWRAEGVKYVLNARTGEKLPLGVSLLEDSHKRRGDIERAVRALKVPLLIIHGDSDEAVPLTAAEKLHDWCSTSELIVIPSGTHTFGMKHPFSGPTPELTQVVTQLATFFSK